MASRWWCPPATVVRQAAIRRVRRARAAGSALTVCARHRTAPALAARNSPIPPTRRCIGRLRPIRPIRARRFLIFPKWCGTKAAPMAAASYGQAAAGSAQRAAHSRATPSHRGKLRRPWPCRPAVSAMCLTWRSLLPAMTVISFIPATPRRPVCMHSAAPRRRRHRLPASWRWSIKKPAIVRATPIQRSTDSRPVSPRTAHRVIFTRSLRATIQCQNIRRVL